ncbi:putative acetyltransferase, GNAT [Acrocarpospora corrugata]|uniref:Putative acetyltransferase, GNAT n=1 Tax=Acrocarpospora corrugata TaxID=35763 RepID=A0A5M3VWR0_9ACTN|nr:GNAT family N-acetyltransferase [Acrocarpospora corrugata]GES00390.1 putative acetyltransferase, GNAT [Acrocarpospora corrugata]
MISPAGYEFRAPTPDDLAAVAAVLIADDLGAGQSILGAGFVGAEWARTGFDLATDAWVALDGAAVIVGYGQASPEEPGAVRSWGTVHPEHRSRGIGSALLDRIEERARELLGDLPAARLRHSMNADDHAAAALLQARGLRPVRHFWYMGIDLAELQEPGPPPPGIEITGIAAPGDLEAVHAVLQEAFAGDWGYHPEPYDQWAEEAVGNPNHDPALWLLVRDNGRPVGALTASAEDDRGWVGEVGVVPSHRGRGIGAHLLRLSFATFAGRGLRDAMLNVDSGNPTGATVLYESVGMRIAWRWDLWERS